MHSISELHTCNPFRELFKPLPVQLLDERLGFYPAVPDVPSGGVEVRLLGIEAIVMVVDATLNIHQLAVG